MKQSHHRYFSLATPLVRIQCKTARYVEEWGCLEFNTAITFAQVGGKPHIRKGYQGEADYFGVYSPDTGKVYVVPVEAVPFGSTAKLRLDGMLDLCSDGL